MNSSLSVIVFAYSLIGHDCLRELIRQGHNIQAVVTHDDNPNEYIWFPCVADLAQAHGIPVFKPFSPNTPDFINQIKDLKPDIIFSFYYRKIISQNILDISRLGGFNMHGSFLPTYRGRCPANWALARGEDTLGATLHRMVRVPDAGNIVAQRAFPIELSDNAMDVIIKTRDTALSLLKRYGPAFSKGPPTTKAQELFNGSYFGGRGLKDAVIDWSKSARNIYNLVRSQLPYPHFPGGITYYQGREIRILDYILPAEFFDDDDNSENKSDNGDKGQGAAPTEGADDRNHKYDALTQGPATKPGQILSSSPHEIQIACHWNADYKTCLESLTFSVWKENETGLQPSFSVGEFLLTHS